MGMHRLGYDIGIVWKVGKNTFVVTVQVYYWHTLKRILQNIEFSGSSLGKPTL
jgi:hypothetical protein